jgi:hypothetical protein
MSARSLSPPPIDQPAGGRTSGSALNRGQDMQFRNILCSAAATLGLIAAQPAWAQTSDSASIDATAVLVEGVTTLSITAQRPMNFGRVAIPNGGLAGHTCLYNMGFAIGSPDDGFILVTELGANGRRFAEGLVTPSGCSAEANMPDGRVVVQCVPGTVVSFQSILVATFLPGIEFDPEAAGYSLSSFDGNDYNSILIPGPGTLPCPAQSNAFATAGEILLSVLGGLTIAANAQPGPADIGSIILNVSY